MFDGESCRRKLNKWLLALNVSVNPQWVWAEQQIEQMRRECRRQKLQDIVRMQERQRKKNSPAEVKLRVEDAPTAWI